MRKLVLACPRCSFGCHSEWIWARQIWIFYDFVCGSCRYHFIAVFLEGGADETLRALRVRNAPHKGDSEN